MYIHIYMSAHIHTYTYIHTHIQNVHMNARKHAWNDGAAAKRARSRCRRRKLRTSLSVDAIKPHFAPPMQGLHCTHFLKHQYPSTPHPLFPTYPGTVRRQRASALLLFYTDQMNRVQSSEEAPRSFTMAPCVVVERLEGKQRCSRAAVSASTRESKPENDQGDCSRRNEGSMMNNQPPQAAHHAITTARRPDNIPLICTGAETIHQVHGLPKPRATESMLRQRIHISAIFPPFSQKKREKEGRGGRKK